MLFSHILSFLKKEQKDEDEEEKKEMKQRKERKKALASVALMLMLLISIYAEPVAAGWPKPQWGWWNELKNNVLGGLGGALAGAKIGAGIGASIGGPVGAAVGTVVGGAIGYIAGAHIEQKIKDKVKSYTDKFCSSKLGQLICPPPDKTTTLQDHKNITKEEFEDDLPIKNALAANLTKEADQAAYQDMQILLSKLKSTIIPYDVQQDGDSGEFASAEIYGPESIYGFSAFPIELKLKPRGTKGVKDPICITTVNIYAKEKDTGRILWTRTWHYNDDTNCIDGGDSDEVWTFETILKPADDYVSLVDNVLNGIADNKTIETLFKAKPNEFEVKAEVIGYRKIYYEINGQWIFDHNEPITAYFSTLSAYRHVGGGTYPLSGFSGSFPTYYKDSPEVSEYTRYLITVAGASSNLVPVVYATPIHILNATSNFKFVVQGNPGYFDPLKPTIIDEARIVVYRILKNGAWELASMIPIEGPATLGDIGTVGKILQASVTYHGDSQTVAYKVFLGLKAYVQRDDGQQIPVWILVEPAIAVQTPELKVLMDQYVTEIGDIVGDNVISAAEAQKLQAIADSIITSLQQKIDLAEEWKKKGEAEDKDLVIEYASKAIYHYREAIKYAEKLKSITDPQDTLRYAEIVKEEEVIGDYYLRAAELAYYGQKGQAQSLVENANKLEENVSNYKGTFLGLPIGGDWKDWLAFILSNLVKIGISIALIIVARKLFGSMGALIVGALVFVWWIGPMFGISL